MQELDHKHILIRATLRTPPTEPDKVKDWFERLVSAVDMKILIPPEVTNCQTEGNKGITGVCTIETSHSSIHVWEEAEVPYLNFDLYSCKRFDPEIVINFIKEFDPYFVHYMLIDRNDDGKNLPFSVAYQENRQIIKIIDLMNDEYRNHYLSSHKAKREGKPLTKEHKKARSIYASLTRKYSMSGKQYSKKRLDEHHSTLACVKYRCKKRGLKFDLTTEWYEQEFNTAKVIFPKLIAHGSTESFWVANIDRIDSTKGYTQDNCRIIPRALNVAKWKWNQSELEDLQSIIKYI